VRKAILIILLLPSLAHAEWTQEDTYLQGAVISSLLIDMAQTLYISDHPDKYCELNPLLGKHPSKDKVVGYFIGAIALHTAISFVLNERERRWFQGGTLFIETGVALRNFSLGIGFSY
jgi:hypothetical protein